ncbi:UDP-N-acetylglucosamine 2-epimerase [Rhodospirillales bacterium]|nr:UDP-N-acetylglucosamine 2-epimerase [Rhodospirillales bacterium]
MTDDVRKICVITGTRAEYGLLYWLMKEIDADPALELQLIVTGSHLSNKYGYTVDTIVKDGFNITARVDIDLDDDSPAGIAHSMGLAISGVAKELVSIQPDIVVVLGDRFEILGAVEAAMVSRYVIAHIHGGEATEGLIDEPIRHAITKMSHLHFATAEPYRERIIQMGESAERVYTVGAPGLDNIDRLQILELDALSIYMGLDLSSGYFLVTYHPVTLSNDDPSIAIEALLVALDEFSQHKIIITGVNADTGNDAINSAILDYAQANPDRVYVSKSLGQQRYLSAMKHCDAVIGNSSSGLIETPTFGVPTVNIGPRQRGRLRASSVIDCGESIEEISLAIHQSLSQKHKDLARTVDNPYGAPGASKRIKEILATAELDGLLMKKFHDISVPI